MALEDIKRTYEDCANLIPNWRDIDKNKLANLYIDNEKDEDLRNAYFSALMLKYWNNVFKFYRTSKSARLEIDDFTSWLSESIMIAFKYRRWRDPTNKLYHDENAPDKVINRCIFSTRMRYYQYYNKLKRCANYTSVSLEGLVSKDSFATSDNFVYEMDDQYVSSIDCNIEVQKLVNERRYQEAIVTDALFFDDYFCMGDKTICLAKVSRYFKAVNSDKLVDYFKENYDNVDEQLLRLTLTNLKRLSNGMMRRYGEYIVHHLESRGIFTNVHRLA